MILHNGTVSWKYVWQEQLVSEIDSTLPGVSVFEVFIYLSLILNEKLFFKKSSLSIMMFLIFYLNYLFTNKSLI